MGTIEIESLPLPATLPHPDAMKSWGHNKASYEPEIWEFEYRAHRYLGRVSDDELHVRYDSIARNMQSIVSADRDVIPIITFLSSWYWYRKEHQARFEFHCRR